jgi:hypothetical protein
MSRRDPRVTAYINERAPFARPVLRRLRQVIRSSNAGLEETIKWGMPAYLHEGKLVCGFAGFKAHCALWFWRGRTIVGRKPAQAMGNFGRITVVDEVPAASMVAGYVKKSIKLIDERHTAKRRSARRAGGRLESAGARRLRSRTP